MTRSPIFDTIENDIQNNDVVLYMKGNAAFPMCGFSGVAVKILEDLNVEFLDRNVLEDEGLREGIKEFSDWPTIPQLYVKGEFVGGCDIMRDMYSSGELQDMLVEKGVISAAA